MDDNNVRPDVFIPTSVISRMPKYLHPLSERMVRRMCEEGVFNTAYKPGMGKRGRWLVSAAEIIQYKIKRHAVKL